MSGYEALIKSILSKAGWKYLRQGKGSHEIWELGKNHITIPKGCKSRHLANEIMKQVGNSHRFN